MLDSYGINVPADKLKVKNVAAVMVTATLPPFARAGTTIDVAVSSLGDARSLQGGTLLQTPLRAANGEVYASSPGTGLHRRVQRRRRRFLGTKNHPTSGPDTGRGAGREGNQDRSRPAGYYQPDAELQRLHDGLPRVQGHRRQAQRPLLQPHRRQQRRRSKCRRSIRATSSSLILADRVSGSDDGYGRQGDRQRAHRDRHHRRRGADIAMRGLARVAGRRDHDTD